jgi:hypothetical protein
VFYGGAGGRVWFNDGFGAFTRFDLGLPVAGKPVLGDVDGDGDRDAVLLERAGGFHVLRNPGTGMPWPVQTVWLPMLPPGVAAQDLALADLDVDGDLDVFVATGGLDAFSFEATAADALWLNDGAGTFTSGGSLLPTVPTASWSVAVGDVDGNGVPDLVTDGGVLYRGQLAAPFVASPFFISQDQGGSTVALGDLDGDGALDVVAGNSCRGLGCAPSGAGAPNVIHWNDGTGGLATSTTLPQTDDTITTAVVLGDVDADGDLDIVFGQRGVTGSGHDNLAENLLFLNDGGRVFRRVGGYAGTEIPLDWDDTNGLALIDVDSDGDDDLLAFNEPVDPGASARHKVHASLIRHLYAPYLARLGHRYVLEIHGVEGYPVTMYLAVGPGRVPVPPYGVWGLDVATTFDIGTLPPPAAGRRVDHSIQIPAAPALAGLELHFQALLWGNPVTASRLTNRVRDVIFAH